MKYSARFLVLIIFAFASSFNLAQAMDEPPGIKALLDVTALQYKGAGASRPTYASITPDGKGGGTLADLKWSMTQKDVTVIFAIAKTVVSGVSKRDSGKYSYELIESSDIKISMVIPEAGPIEINIPVTTTKNLHILPRAAPGAADYSAFTGLVVYEAGSVPVINITTGGQTFQANGFSTAFAGDKETGLGKWDVALKSVVIPVSAIPDPNFQKDMQERFGYEQFDVGFNLSAAIKAKQGNVDIAYAARTVARDVGAIEFALAGQDIPAQLAAVLKDVQAGSPPNIGKIMPLLLGIKVSRFQLRFVDHSVTKKALDFAAYKQGKTVDTLKAEGAAMIQLGLGQLRIPEFTASVVAAYKAFVSNPVNISLEAKPAQPVAFATLMGMMAAPGVAIQALGVKVEANK